MSIAKNAKVKISRAKLVGICLNGIAQSMPPTFCEKKGADVGTVPSGCPKGYFRSLALCLEKCKKGYKWDKGFVCTQTCPRGYKTYPTMCFKNLSKLHTRKSYSQKTLTNSSKKVPCPTGKYKVGALCYKNCKVIGMQNCGISACALSKKDCTAKIVSKVIDAVSDLSDLLLFITSFKSSSALKAAKNSVEQGLKKLKKRRVKKIAKSSLKAFKSSFFKVYAKKGVNYAQHIIKLMEKKQLKKRLNKSLKNREKKGIKDKIKEKAKEADVDGITNTVVYAVCSEAFAHLKKKKEKQINFKNIISSVDAFKISPKGVKALKACKENTTAKDGGILCGAQLIFDSSSADPMGLSTLGSAFMHQTCDIPNKIHEPSYNKKELKKYFYHARWSAFAKEYKKENRKIKVKRGCVRMFQFTHYRGKSKTYCKNTKFVGRKYNDTWSSCVVGDDTDVMFYEHANYKGKTFRPKGRSTPIVGTVQYNSVISSLKVAKKENRIIFYRESNYNGPAWMFTKGEKLSHLGGDQNDRYSSVLVGKNVRVRVRQHKDYRGKHWTITKSVKRFSRKWNDEISSFKVLAK